MITRKAGFDSAIVVLHEIYGINQHIYGVCQECFSDGYDVYCPNLLTIDKPFDYSSQEEAYTYFNQNVGFEIYNQVNQLLEEIRPYYKRIILLGFSIGATIAWICGESGLCDDIICYYGSRIRDYLSIAPKCRALVLFASNEKSFDVEIVVKTLKDKCNITTGILKGNHGFCDPFSGSFNSEAARIAKQLTKKFLME